MVPMVKRGNELPWVDKDIVNASYRRITEKIPEETICRNPDQINFDTLTYDDFRDLQTAIEVIGLKNNMYQEKGFYDNRNHVKEEIWKFIYGRMGSLAAIFDFVVKSRNPELWTTSPYNVFLSRTSHKGMTEMSILKASVILKHYIDMGLKIEPENLFTIHRIVNKIPYWEFGNAIPVGLDLYDPKQFERANALRKKEIIIQDKFINSIFKDQNYAAAYDLIKERDDK